MNIEQKIKKFNSLKGYSQNLIDIPYETIYDILKEIGIPICEAKLKKGTFIDRARKNNEIKLFEKIEQLGYIKDANVISTKMRDYGRANSPHQVMFYGAIPSEMKEQRGIAIAETSDLFRNFEGDCLEGELYTLSRWEVLEDLNVCEIVFSDEALKYNRYVRDSYEKQQSFLNQIELTEEEKKFHLDLLKFISNQFSKIVKNKNEYKISVAYTNLVLDHRPNIKGIAFPSVQTQFLGTNIVLKPDNVDRYLKPTTCTMHKLYKKEFNYVVANEGYYCEVKDNGYTLDWQYNEEKTGVIPNSEIIRILTN